MLDLLCAWKTRSEMVQKIGLFAVQDKINFVVGASVYYTHSSGFITKILLCKTVGDKDMSSILPQIWHAMRVEMLLTLSISSDGSIVRSFMSTLHI